MRGPWSEGNDVAAAATPVGRSGAPPGPRIAMTLLGSLLLSLAATGVVLLFVLRRPPVRLVVPATFLWQRLAPTKRRRRHRFRWWLSLFLALLIAEGLALALARSPWLSRGGHESRERWVLLLDGSPSMAAAASSDRRRFDLAKAAATESLSQLDQSVEVKVAVTTAPAETSPWLSPTTARERLDSLSLGSTELASSRWWTSLVAPADAVNSGYAPRLLFFTDGVTPQSLPPGSEERSVFAAADNVGVTAFEVRAHPRESGHYIGFFEILQAADESRQVRVEIRDNGGLRYSSELELGARELWSATLDLSSFEPGELEAAVTYVSGDGRDAFPLDDRVVAWLPSARFETRLTQSPVVDSEAAGLLALRDFLEADEGLSLVAEEDDSRRPTTTPTLLIYYREAPDERPRQPALLIDPPARDWLASTTSAVPKGSPLVADLRQPTELASSLRIDTDTPRLVVVGGDLSVLLTDPADRPVFLDATIDWLTGRRDDEGMLGAFVPSTADDYGSTMTPGRALSNLNASSLVAAESQGAAEDAAAAERAGSWLPRPGALLLFALVLALVETVTAALRWTL